VMQDTSVTHDDVAVMDACLTPPHSSLNSSTGSPCSTVTDSQGPQSPLFQEDLSPVAIEGSLHIHCLYIRDVQNKFFYFGSVFEKTWIRFGINLVRFGSKNVVRFGYDSYLVLSCNSSVVNLQQILQRQWMT